ncbi:MAG TPA: hypothetical protein VLF39_02765 [Candidatus Saccharimonadales bacterium]|nr:hypothetical protein [Candidatus Saccharimonadales bacterium]
MINLLPTDVYQSITFARRNTRLVDWILAVLGGIAIIIIIVISGYFVINRSARDYQKQADSSEQQLKIEKLDETQARVKDISASLNLVVSVLSKEILFSKLLQQIGSVMPPGSSLAGLSISKVQGGLDLSAVAKNYQTATQVQLNLQDPNNKIFTKADIVSVSCSSTSSDVNYPCQINLRAVFAKDNTFLFINSAGS